MLLRRRRLQPAKTRRTFSCNSLLGRTCEEPCRRTISGSRLRTLPLVSEYIFSHIVTVLRSNCSAAHFEDWDGCFCQRSNAARPFHGQMIGILTVKGRSSLGGRNRMAECQNDTTCHAARQNLIGMPFRGQFVSGTMVTEDCGTLENKVHRGIRTHPIVTSGSGR
jgi:hypothetical protein